MGRSSLGSVILDHGVWVAICRGGIFIYWILLMCFTTTKNFLDLFGQKNLGEYRVVVSDSNFGIGNFHTSDASVNETKSSQ